MLRVLPAALITCLAAALLVVGTPATAASTAPAAETASTYTSLAPARVLDTRLGAGPVGGGGTITVNLAARVPTTATAVVLNVTGVTPTAATFISVFPGGGALPISSNLNLTPGDTRPNQVTVALGTGRTVSLYNNAGSTHLVVDLAGYYGTAPGAKFTALPSNRVIDTRLSAAPISPGGTLVVDLGTAIPASATAVTFNLTATEATASTFVTAWPTGTPLPTASNLNVPAGDTRPNLVTVAVGANRQVSLFNNAGWIHLIVDVTGFYTPDYGSSFVPLNPSRLLDTRIGTGGSSGPVGQSAIDLDLAEQVPLTSTGAVLNITGVDATAATFVTAWPQYENPPTAGSILNLSAGQTVPNAAAVAFSRTTAVQLFNNAGTVHLIADLAGYFAVLEPPCTTGCVHAWGENFSRKLGTAQAVFDSPTPTPVVGLSGVTAVDGGDLQTGYALRNDGTVWAWGNNEVGQLGNGWASRSASGGSPVPVPVVGLTGITAIAASGFTAFALRDDGTVWAWGANPHGLLGNGSTAPSFNTPVLVNGLNGVIGIATTGATAYALRDNGTVWSWGHNGTGALGNGSTVESSPTPVQVSGSTGGTKVAAMGAGGLMHRDDGTVWSWGDNAEGQLGNNSTAAYSSTPVQVSGLTTATAIAGGQYNGYAVLADGTVRAWGAGSNGALGSGVDCGAVAFPCASRVPVVVSNLDDVEEVASFEYGGYALHTDGTVSAWGFNGYHSLGNDSAYWESLVPVPVLGVSGVSAIGAAEYSGYAVVS